MDVKDISTVAVIGLGTLGRGLAETLARSGRAVIGVDTDPAAAARAAGALDASLARAVRRGDLTGREHRSAMAGLRTSTDPRAAADAEFVVEAVPESYEEKRDVLRALDAVVRPDTVLATGTNALSVTRLAAGTAHPERVVGMHFFHPAPVMRLVEVVRTVFTSPAALDAVTALARGLGKEPVAAGDRPGFVADGLLLRYLNRAAAMYESGYASRDDIDAAMRLGCGLPMGPLALLDLIGLDTARAVLEAMYQESGDRLDAPAPVLGRLIAAGLAGRKSGRGFYRYAADGAAARAHRPAAAVAPPAGTVGIAGSGTMAAGIAEVFAKSGHRVVLAGRTDAKARAAREKVASSLRRSVDKKRMPVEAADATLGRVGTAGSLDALAGADLALEAVAEDLDVKRGLFRALDGVCREGAVLATTTSSLPVVACARATARPEDVAGMHFFNPAPAMGLVEVVRTVLTSDAAHARVRDAALAAGKHPVDCGDRAGFIVNALLFPYLNDAVRMVQDHYATPDDVDTAMRLGAGYPMGPFELLDVVGLDVSLAIERSLHEEFRDPSLAPAPLLERLVAAGFLGRKSGRGFRAYARD
ncbi:3-hydroxyacyl-CoA dehydrogenase family protein [Streptomyces sp. 8L]|uniref:3-hydroxyacyl-CoA dehydrogenase family protein n=1 Tax=Streptomyces sp. 8L TaxID=2877242 RepID=UPI001CD78D1C|nr:3-hydroxyacyl-CoA dehydrogenase [Streptomyces sp. 8L]MCA1219616.1 NAD(P)-binding domain-containing protein [Streptomyces sp. 8L]